jgi:hypothetical protein
VRLEMVAAQIARAIWAALFCLPIGEASLAAMRRGKPPYFNANSSGCPNFFKCATTR